VPQLRLDQRLLLRGSRPIFLFAAAPVLAAAVAVAAAGPGRAPSHEALVEAVRRIQNVCFATYPPDLVRRLTGRDDVPAEVRDDPALQMKSFVITDKREKGLFYPTSLDDVLDAFESEVRPGLRLLDLGSGDGRVVFLSAVLGADATGVEWEESLHRLALDARGRLSDLVPKGRAHLKAGDFLREDFTRYDLLFYFESGTFDATALFDKIRRELRPGARLLVAHGILPPEGLHETAAYGVVKVYVRPQDGAPP
jgi:SAM-dependent methyltransferase